MSENTTKRAVLTPARIELAALDLIGEIGLGAFSMRKLGEKLGCEAMSIYHHFPNKEHLLDALVDRLVAGVEVPPHGLDPVSRLRGLARGWRAMNLRHPHFLPVLSLHRLNSAVCVRFLNEILLALLAAGLGREAAARTFRAMAYFLVGAALDEIAGYGKGPSSLHPVGDAELARDFPELAAAGEYFSPEHFERTFETGLDLFLRGARLIP